MLRVLEYRGLLHFLVYITRVEIPPSPSPAFEVLPGVGKVKFGKRTAKLGCRDCTLARRGGKKISDFSTNFPV